MARILPKSLTATKNLGLGSSPTALQPGGGYQVPVDQVRGKGTLETAKTTARKRRPSEDTQFLSTRDRTLGEQGIEKVWNAIASGRDLFQSGRDQEVPFARVAFDALYPDQSRV